MRGDGGRGPINLRSVDLNLLVAFDALMREQQVTRAARLLGIGQPAMSAALSRLRQLMTEASATAGLT